MFMERKWSLFVCLSRLVSLVNTVANYWHDSQNAVSAVCCLFGRIRFEGVKLCKTQSYLFSQIIIRNSRGQPKKKKRVDSSDMTQLSNAASPVRLYTQHAENCTCLCTTFISHSNGMALGMVPSPIWFRLKYLHRYLIDSIGILHTHSWFLEDDTY